MRYRSLLRGICGLKCLVDGRDRTPVAQPSNSRSMERICFQMSGLERCLREQHLPTFDPGVKVCRVDCEEVHVRSRQNDGGLHSLPKWLLARFRQTFATPMLSRSFVLSIYRYSHILCTFRRLVVSHHTMYEDRLVRYHGFVHIGSTHLRLESTAVFACLCHPSSFRWLFLLHYWLLKLRHTKPSGYRIDRYLL